MSKKNRLLLPGSALVLHCAVILCCIIFFPVTGYGSSGSVLGMKNEARKYYLGAGVKQDYAKAFELYRRAADRGDALARYICGGMYFRGLGVKKDSRAAFRYLYQAALQGKSSGRAERILGEAFFLGRGTLRNYKEAFYWYGRSAAHGDSEAQNILGYMYFVGRGVERDQRKGGEYFLQAAENDSPVAQYNVGIMYSTGNGVGEIDLVKAYGWINIAAASGYEPAVIARDYLEKLLTLEELTEAQELAGKLGKELNKRH
jgi:TPR repeat protein